MRVMHAEKECIAKTKKPGSLTPSMKIPAADFRQRLLPILLAQAVGLICGTLGVRLTSRLVAPGDYGLYGLFVSLAPIGTFVVYAGLGKFVQRHWRGTTDRAGLLHELWLASLRKFPLLLAAVAAGTWLAAPDHRLAFGALFLGSAFLLMWTSLMQAALQADRRHWQDLGLASGLSATRSFLPPLLYSLLGAGPLPLFLGYFGHTVFGAVLGVWNLRPWWRQAPAEPRTPHLTAQYLGPQFIILAIVAWSLLGLNRWLVAWRYGAETAGYFTLAGNIGILLPAMLGTVALQYRQPAWFAAESATLEQRRALLRRIDQAALVYTVLALAAAGLLHLAMPLLVGPLVNARYLPAAPLVLVTGFFFASLTIGTFYHNLLLAAKRESACRYADLSGAFCLILGCGLSAFAGFGYFRAWLLFSPVVPWLVNRTVARRLLLRPA